MKVYRIVDKKGRGLYRDLAEKIGMSLSASDEHPTPYMDSQLTREQQKKDLEFSDKRYCFASIEQLKRWMYNDEWIKEAIQLKAKVYTFEVEAKYLAVGTTQAIFVQGKAKLVKKQTLDFLLEETLTTERNTKNESNLSNLGNILSRISSRFWNCEASASYFLDELYADNDNQATLRILERGNSHTRGDSSPWFISLDASTFGEHTKSPGRILPNPPAILGKVSRSPRKVIRKAGR